MENYEFKKILGRGGQGVVFLVENKKTKKMVAMKRINSDSLETANSAIKELITIQKLNKKGDGIVEYIDLFLDQKKEFGNVLEFIICVVMTYYNDGDLQDYINQFYNEEEKGKFLPENIVKNFLSQLASSLGLIHENLIIHRDLKPGNIFIKKNKDKPPTLLIGDFGFSSFRDSGSKLSSFVGTYSYMSCELVSNSKYDEKADLFSLGMVLICLMTGEAPSYQIKLLTKYKETIKQIKKSLNNYSDPLVDIVLALLHPDPEKRINTTELLKLIDEMEYKKPKKPMTQDEKDLLDLYENDTGEKTEDLYIPNENTANLPASYFVGEKPQYPISKSSYGTEGYSFNRHSNVMSELRQASKMNTFKAQHEVSVPTQEKKIIDKSEQKREMYRQKKFSKRKQRQSIQSKRMVENLSKGKKEEIILVVGNSFVELTKKNILSYISKKISSNKRIKYQWTLFVREKEDYGRIGSIVEEVHVELHPTFIPNKIILNKSPFQVSKNGWGEFNAKILIVFKENLKLKNLNVIHHITLEGNGNSKEYKIKLNPK